MKRKIVGLLLIVMLLVFTSFTFVACGKVDPYSNVVFDDMSINYDGEEHTIEATGVPEEADVVYTNAGPFTLPGTYEIGVTISVEGQEPYEDSATLTISALSFSTVSFNDISIDYDGEEHTIEATGIPAGASAVYTNAGPFTMPGEYEIGVTINAVGYVQYQKTVTLTINALNFTGIGFTSDSVDYNGEGHTVEATGVPADATVVYTNAGPFTNAGTYTITINVSKQGYNTFTKSVQLTINKIDFSSSITFEDKKVIATGSEKELLITGQLPEGTQVTYVNNKGTQAGVYEATATLTNPNYNTKTLNAVLTIINVLNKAKETVDTLLERPDAWSFMPEAFSKEELAYVNSPVLNFETFQNVNNIKSKFMGKQMYVLWEGLKGMDALLEKFDVVFAAGEAIATTYQNFINDNPENYSIWTGSAAGLKLKIELNESQSKMLAGNNLFSLELFADTEENINKGRIQLAENGILNYEMQDNYLKFNISLMIKGVMTTKQIEFVRNDDTGVVSGYFYQYTGVDAAAIKTSAVIAFNEDYAIIMSAKRESDDLLIEGYEEVYSAQTGEYLAAKVVETNKLVKFDTYWVNLYDVSGITTVKAVANGNLRPDDNHHDVYINGVNTVFAPKYNSLLGLKTSRRFDIEMKTVYYVTKTTNGEDVEYEVVETEIPMLFIQSDNVADFSSEVKQMNTGVFTTNPTLPTEDMEVARANAEGLQLLLNTIKETLTYNELINQLGTKDPFFNEQQ